MEKQNSLFILLLLLLSPFSYSQQKMQVPEKFPTDYGTFTFPLGSKILIETKPASENKYEYKVVSIEPVKGYYSLEKNENIFSKTPQKNTIELFFMGAYYNEGKEDKDYKTILMVRNNNDIPLDYKADIKYYFSDKFENTSIVSIYPKVKGVEIWGHKIDYITLYGFEKAKR